LSEADWREAFTHHPKIGDVSALREKFASTATWAAGEQGAVRQASQSTLEALAAGNEAYAQRFGYIFIVCATGKSAAEMLALLQARLPHEPAQEIKIAMSEQAKITRLRLEKLLA
ncbi:MAG: OHCU decarboxylase, partial [Hymenobacter sp.]